mmetsp:Transcript_49087/g.60319  ORF Transcript_49087/g.60319 Transcript_49087/m.60319 type:complete len:380 (+) Transcript_49087:52-1191(+)
MALTYIDELERKNPDLSDSLGKCNLYYKRKLWHQLTNTINEMLKKNSEASLGIDFIIFEEKFIREFRKSMNLLSYASIIIEIASQTCVNNDGLALKLLSQGLDFVKDNNAKLLIRSKMAYYYMNTDIKKTINDLNDIFDDINKSVKAPPAVVYSEYYLSSALLYKQQNNPEKFYTNAMGYLGYSNINDVSNILLWANDIVIAALVSKRFFDFGELSLLPAIQKLKGTPREWVFNIVKAYINADVNYYNQITKTHKNELETESLLKGRKHILDEKIQLLTLVRLAFDKPSFERILTFDEIIKVTKSTKDEVELMVMKAMSLELLSGIIDEIDETVSINYVKPRILDLNEIKNITSKVDKWVSKIETTSTKIAPIITKLFN